MDQNPLKALKDLNDLDIRHVFDSIKTGFTPQRKSVGFFNDQTQHDLLNAMETPTLFSTPTSEEANFFGKNTLENNITKFTTINEIKLEPSIPSFQPMTNHAMMSVNDPVKYSDNSMINSIHCTNEKQELPHASGFPQLQSSPTGSLYSKRQAIHPYHENLSFTRIRPNSPCSSIYLTSHNLSSTTSRSGSPQQNPFETNLNSYSVKHCEEFPSFLQNIKMEGNQTSLLPIPSTTKPSKLKTKPPLCKRFACAICQCPRVFARLDELKRHMRSHDNVRPYACDICEKSFTRSDHLRTHRRTHTGEKPFTCVTCTKGFARSDELARHKKVHDKGNNRSSRRNSKLPPSATPNSCEMSMKTTTQVSTNMSMSTMVIPPLPPVSSGHPSHMMYSNSLHLNNSHHHLHVSLPVSVPQSSSSLVYSFPPSYH